jgi:hypothetical protein
VIARAALWAWGFVVGDDWRTAAGVVAILGATALLSASAAAWWLAPPAVLAVLYWSVRRVARLSEPGSPRTAGRSRSKGSASLP